MAKRKKRGNGEGSVHPVKGKNLWRAAVTLGHKPDGKRDRRYAYGKTKADALDELRKLLAKGPAAPTGSGKVNVATIVNRYLARPPRPLEPTTLDSYKTVADTHILPRIGTLPANKVNREHVAYVLDQMAEAGLSGSKRRHALTVMRQAFAMAVSEEVIGANPATGVPQPKADPKPTKPLDRKAVAVFLESLRAHRLYALFVASIATGLRQGELLGLRWEDVDPDRGVMVVTRKIVEVRNVFHEGPPKTAAGRRTVTLPTIAVEALRRHRAAAEAKAAEKDQPVSPLVFPNRKGGPLRRQNLGRMMGRLLSAAGIDRVRFHDLRHTAATLLLESGEQPKVVQERLGHTKVTTTLAIYGHVLPGMQEKAADRMQSILSPSGQSEATHDRGSQSAGTVHRQGRRRAAGPRPRRPTAPRRRDRRVPRGV